MNECSYTACERDKCVRAPVRRIDRYIFFSRQQQPAATNIGRDEFSNARFAQFLSVVRDVPYVLFGSWMFSESRRKKERLKT